MKEEVKLKMVFKGNLNDKGIANSKLFFNINYEINKIKFKKIQKYTLTFLFTFLTK